MPSRSSTLFSAAQPASIDVSPASKSEHSDLIIQALNDMGLGHRQRMTVDFSIRFLFAGKNIPRVNIVGSDGCCYGGANCDRGPQR